MQVKQECAKNQRLSRPLGKPAADSFILTTGSHSQEHHLITNGKYTEYPPLTCVTTETFPVTLIPSAHDTR